MSLYSRLWPAALLPLLVYGCASQAQPSDGTGPSQASVLTREEMQGVNVRNLYDAIQELRPRWLYVRAVRSFNRDTEIVVFQDRLFLGTPDQLRQLGLDGVYWLEYIDGPTAQATLPGLRDRHVEGAIVIHMTPREGGG